MSVTEIAGNKHKNYINFGSSSFFRSLLTIKHLVLSQLVQQIVGSTRIREANTRDLTEEASGGQEPQRLTRLPNCQVVA